MMRLSSACAAVGLVLVALAVQGCHKSVGLDEKEAKAIQMAEQANYHNKWAKDMCQGACTKGSDLTTSHACSESWQTYEHDKCKKCLADFHKKEPKSCKKYDAAVADSAVKEAAAAKMEAKVELKRAEAKKAKAEKAAAAAKKKEEEAKAGKKGASADAEKVKKTEETDKTKAEEEAKKKADEAKKAADDAKTDDAKTDDAKKFEDDDDEDLEDLLQDKFEATEAVNSHLRSRLAAYERMSNFATGSLGFVAVAAVIAFVVHRKRQQAAVAMELPLVSSDE